MLMMTDTNQLSDPSGLSVSAGRAETSLARLADAIDLAKRIIANGVDTPEETFSELDKATDD